MSPKLRLTTVLLLWTILGFGLSIVLFLALSKRFMPEAADTLSQHSGLLPILLTLFISSWLMPALTLKNTKDIYVNRAQNWMPASYLLNFGFLWGFMPAVTTLLFKMGADEDISQFWPVSAILFVAGLTGGCVYGWGHRSLFRRLFI